MNGTKGKDGSRGVSFKGLVLALALAAIVPSILFQKVLMIMFVPSESMFPAMTAGDVLLGSRGCSEFKRGDIVAFQGESVVMIKRIVGLPGETVRIDGTGLVYIDGEPLEEPYIKNQRQGQPQSFVVPDGCVLLLGDNRQESYDARYWDNPYVEEAAILAVAKYILFGGRLC